MNLHSTASKNNRLELLKQEKAGSDVLKSVVKCRYCDGHCIKNGKRKKRATTV